MVNEKNKQMLNEQKKQSLNQFLSDLSKEQISWVSGYLAGLVGEVEVVQTAKISNDVLVFYVTDTGNSKKIAGDLVVKIKAAGGRAQ